MPTDDTMNLEELARQAGYDVDPEGIAMPIYHADGSADERAQLTRFAALVQDDAARFLEAHSRETYGAALREHNEAAAWLRALKDKP